MAHRRLRGSAVLAAFLLPFLAQQAFAQSRIVDIATVRGVRANHLVGYGLVLGLNGTGDSLRDAPFTQQSMQSMLERMGVNIRNAQARTRNIAAVVVMAELPPFAGRGNRIDVTVASLGDATSLAGGSLMLTPMTGADDLVYAVAQGPIAVGGLSVAGKSETVTHGVPTAGRIPNGAVVERDAPAGMPHGSTIELELRNPDVRTAVRMAAAINAFTRAKYRQSLATERDMKAVVVTRPPQVNPLRFLAELSEIEIVPEVPARVVVDERTGTIVIGSDVQVSTVAVAHGNVVVRVTDSPAVSQPSPFSNGKTTVTADTTIDVRQNGGAFHIVRGAKLEALVSGLNRMGLKPGGIIAVLQAVKTAGALQAELIIQ